MSGVGQGILDEVHLHEKAVGLSDLFETPDIAKQQGIFRISSSDGVLYEMGLVGGWGGDPDRLLEFDRPPKHRLRLYFEPRHTTRREISLTRAESHVEIDIDEMAVPYVDLLLSEVLRVAEVHNVRKLQERLDVGRFLELYGGWTGEDVDGVMVRYLVNVKSGDPEEDPSSEVRTCAAVAETTCADLVAGLEGRGWAVQNSTSHVLQSCAEPELAGKVRAYTEGVGVCTYWDDGACGDFAELVAKEGAESILESRASFFEWVEKVRRGGSVHGIAPGVHEKLRSFIESHLYPDEPLS